MAAVKRLPKILKRSNKYPVPSPVSWEGTGYGCIRGKGGFPRDVASAASRGCCSRYSTDVLGSTAQNLLHNLQSREGLPAKQGEQGHIHGHMSDSRPSDSLLHEGR